MNNEDIEILEELKEEYSKGLERLNDKDLSWCMQNIYTLRKKQVQTLINLLTRYKQEQLTDKEKEVVEAYRNLVKHTGKTDGWVVCDPKQMWSDYFIPKSKVKEKIEELDNMLQESVTGKLQKYAVNEMICMKVALTRLLKEE